MLNRDKLLHKVRALMAKTIENGCSEEEAMAALDKARAMIDAYEITDAELALTKEQKAELREDPGTDHHRIRDFLDMAVAAFTDTKCYRSRKRVEGRKRAIFKTIFVGLPADVQLAFWLLDTLQDFVMTELAEYLMASRLPRGQRRAAINGFVLGCTTRINNRLYDLVKKSKEAQASNSRALVVVKTGLITDALNAAGVSLSKSRSHYSRSINNEGFSAGQAAGDRATFSRPVGGGNLRLSR